MGQGDSPGRQHRAVKVFVDAIRFGPAYYRLLIDGRMVPGRLFGEPLEWSDDSRLLAAQEWLTTDDWEGPITRAVLIDVETWTIAPLKAVLKGFSESFRFEEGRFVYRKVFARTGEDAIVEAEVDMSDITNWVSLSVAEG